MKWIVMKIFNREMVRCGKDFVFEKFKWKIHLKRNEKVKNFSSRLYFLYFRQSTNCVRHSTHCILHKYFTTLYKVHLLQQLYCIKCIYCKNSLQCQLGNSIDKDIFDGHYKQAATSSIFMWNFLWNSHSLTDVFHCCSTPSFTEWMV